MSIWIETFVNVINLCILIVFSLGNCVRGNGLGCVLVCIQDEHAANGQAMLFLWQSGARTRGVWGERAGARTPCNTIHYLAMSFIIAEKYEITQMLRWNERVCKRFHSVFHFHKQTKPVEKKNREREIERVHERSSEQKIHTVSSCQRKLHSLSLALLCSTCTVCSLITVMCLHTYACAQFMPFPTFCYSILH